MNALASPEVGKYINEYFVSSFQKVATFQILDGTKVGGNVASYFCAPDGRVLHCVPGPVDSATMLAQARWVVETVTGCLEESKSSGTPFKVLLRKAHAERLRTEHGLVVEPVTFDSPELLASENDPLSYRDPTGRLLVPALPRPPIDGPDVSFRAMQEREGRLAGAAQVFDKAGEGWFLGTQGSAHQLLAAYSLLKIERLYASVFENILGERVTTDPVVTIRGRVDSRRAPCLYCESRRGE